MERVYMYSFHERAWHWVQAVIFVLMIETGIEIHLPAQFSLMGFRNAVYVHTSLAFILLGNAILGLLYHLFTGEIRQFLPTPGGFISDAIKQGGYYLHGIFKGAPHPFQKSPHHKLNPLQQITYLMILNVLLPLQLVTGFMMWGAQRWSTPMKWIGDLSFLAPLHTLTAWLFCAFLLMHVYLTTTGHSPLTYMKAMILGWEEIGEPEAATLKEKP
jgi:thiosulfate reductase cytochrome b subunit